MNVNNTNDAPTTQDINITTDEDNSIDIILNGFDAMEIH